ncbi:MAG: ornithine carbamoyltransferase [Vampirovibrionales bacterium]
MSLSSSSVLELSVESLLQSPALASLQGKSLHEVYDLTSEQTLALLHLAQHLKQLKRSGMPHAFLQGQHAALYFEQPSTRTRLSFETALRDLGVHTYFLKQDEVGLGKRESIADVARTLARFVQSIVIRHLNDADIIELAQQAGVPVVNALSRGHHPCQALADALTMLEVWGSLRGKTVAFVGDASNNVAKSLMQVASLTGMNGILCGPEGYMLEAAEVERIHATMQAQGGTLLCTHNLEEALQHADAIYTDVFTSMGQEAEKVMRLQALGGYQLNDQAMALAPQHAVVLHCLPAHRGEEITHEVLEAHAATVFEQAKNRHHAQKALMLALMNK